MPPKIVRIGTRGSLLALTQANAVQRLLEKKYPGVLFKQVVIKTYGDEFQSVELFKKNQVGVFTKALEKHLLQKQIDIAVHSLKDLPTDLPKSLILAAIPKREDVQDVLISRKRDTIQSLPKGSVIGTSSLRRKRQIEHLRPDIQVVAMRGNLDTRMKRVLKERRFDAVVLARAGLKRIKRFLNYARTISPEQILPAAGQGALGIQARRSDRELLKMLKTLNHPESAICIRSERAFLKTLQGGCRIPAGIYSRIVGKKLYLRAGVFSLYENASVKAELAGSSNAPEELGARLAKLLLKNGASQFLREARQRG